MKSTYLALAGTLLLGVTNAVDMSKYQPGPGVEPAFFEYLKQLYAETEDPLSDQSFYNFFHPPGNLTIVSQVAIGHDAIIALKHQIVPPEGYKHLNHKPNITNVVSQTSTQKIYYVQGVIQTTNTLPTVNNCSQAYYQSRFTVLKDALGNPNLVPHGGGLVIYNDFVVDPSNSPANIACKASG